MTIDKNGNYHPHYHIIYENDKTFTKKWIQTEWAKVCNYGDKYQIISLQKLNGQNVSRELTKYILKFEEIQPNKKQMTIIDNALKGVRKYASNGTFLKTQQEIEKQIEKEEFEKMINLEEYESIVSFYKWFGNSYQLEQQQTIPAERKNVV